MDGLFFIDDACMKIYSGTEKMESDGTEWKLGGME